MVPVKGIMIFHDPIEIVMPDALFLTFFFALGLFVDSFEVVNVQEDLFINAFGTGPIRQFLLKSNP